MRKIVTEEMLQEWRERYLAGETARSIWQDYKDQFAECTVEKRIRQMGISRGKGFIPHIEANKQNIIDDFKTGNYYCYELAEKYNCNDRTIAALLKREGIEVLRGMKSSCNENYFENIDTPHKAYLLGFITADGSIIGKYNSACAIEVHEHDRALIEFAKEQINPEATITECHTEGKNNCRVNFSSKKMCEDLSKYNIIPNKSKTITRVPIELIPDNLLRFYFRGLIDGDGCIHLDGKVSIYSGSLQFIQHVQQVLISKLDLTQLKIYHGTTWFISWSSKKDRQKLYDYLYKDCLEDTFYFKRKYDRLYNSLYDNP